MKVFKFGGASVKDAAAVKNVASIIQKFPNDKLVIVISAMGKVTNALEDLHRERFHNGNTIEVIERIKAYHQSIGEELFGNKYDEAMAPVIALFEKMQLQTNPCSKNPLFESRFVEKQVLKTSRLKKTF